MTPRGFHYGQEYYGTFSRSLYTLFQVLTGESWSEMVVRPLLLSATSSAFVVGGFFTLYILLTQVVLQNVVVAVLLDNFVTDDSPQEEDTPAAPAAAPATSSSAGASAAALSDGGAPMAEENQALRADLKKVMQEQKAIQEQMAALLARLPTASEASMTA
jgi:hypothetical protein